jgi:hypothetical protein
LSNGSPVEFDIFPNTLPLHHNDDWDNVGIDINDGGVKEF